MVGSSQTCEENVREVFPRSESIGGGRRSTSNDYGSAENKVWTLQTENCEMHESRVYAGCTVFTDKAMPNSFVVVR